MVDDLLPEFLWEIELYSGEIVKIEGKYAKQIQAKIAKQEGAITSSTRSIVIKDIRDFRQSEERFTDKKLLEGASQAFNTPIITELGVKCKWVKIPVSRKRWESYYSQLPSYHLVSSDEHGVWTGFACPVHQINYQRVQDMSATEIADVSRHA